jgi:hypothetical protein
MEFVRLEMGLKVFELAIHAVRTIFKKFGQTWRPDLFLARHSL